MSYNEPKEKREVRHAMLGTGCLCFWCWDVIRGDRPVAYADKGCTLVLCERCDGVAKTGMKWWAESVHNPYSIKNKRKAAKKL